VKKTLGVLIVMVGICGLCFGEILNFKCEVFQIGVVNCSWESYGIYDHFEIFILGEDGDYQDQTKVNSFNFSASTVEQVDQDLCGTLIVQIQGCFTESCTEGMSAISNEHGAIKQIDYEIGCCPSFYPSIADLDCEFEEDYLVCDLTLEEGNEENYHYLASVNGAYSETYESVPFYIPLDYLKCGKNLIEVKTVCKESFLYGSTEIKEKRIFYDCDRESCPAYCEGNIAFTDGYFEDGKCHYKERKCEDEYGSWKYFCNGNELWEKRDHIKKWCSDGECKSSKEEEKLMIEICAYGCSNGACNPNPCENVTCSSYCEGSIAYEGHCENGKCIYTQTDCTKEKYTDWEISCDGNVLKKVREHIRGICQEGKCKEIRETEDQSVSCLYGCYENACMSPEYEENGDFTLLSDYDVLTADYFRFLGVSMIGEALKNNPDLFKRAADFLTSSSEISEMMKEIKNAPSFKQVVPKFVTLAEDEKTSVLFRVRKDFSTKLNKWIIKSELRIRNKLIPLLDADGAIVQYPHSFHLFNARYVHVDFEPLSTQELKTWNLPIKMKELFNQHFQAPSGNHAGFKIWDPIKGKYKKALIDLTGPSAYRPTTSIRVNWNLQDKTFVVTSDYFHFAKGAPQKLSYPESIRMPFTIRSVEIAKNSISSMQKGIFDGYSIEEGFEKAFRNAIDDTKNLLRTMKVSEFKGSPEGKLAWIAKTTGREVKGLNPKLLKYGSRVLKIAGIVGTIYLAYDIGKDIYKGNYKGALCTVSETVGCITGATIAGELVGTLALASAPSGIGPLIIEGIATLVGCIAGSLAADKVVCEGILVKLFDGEEIEISNEDLKRLELDELVDGNKLLPAPKTNSSHFYVGTIREENKDLVIVQPSDRSNTYVVSSELNQPSISLYTKSTREIQFERVYYDQLFRDFDEFVSSRIGFTEKDGFYTRLADFNKDGIIDMDDLEDYYNAKSYESRSGGEIK